jgi:serine/threonine protein kinase/tetratricopeptide (TPR) repeat protein
VKPDLASRAHGVLTLVLGLERSQRESKLREACGGDEELLARVSRLLKAADESESFLESPALAKAAAEPAKVPDAIGTYLVIGVLGVGGMATVYEAVQENPHRRVALKVMHQTMTRTDALLRFRLEAQTLARLHHPGIAQIYEAGTAPIGQPKPSPFFAMELISRAMTITQYAVLHRLTLRQRLAMFALVCDAVLYGHQNGVIHRDLKPANILVGADGQAKVIDFGIARSTETGTPAITEAADSSTLIGTLHSMSPEQCVDPGSIDVRSDVYSLGVVLYELVTGRLPHDLTRCSIPQAVRIIVEGQPARAGTLAPEATGDLEAVIATAMHKDRTRRYAGAGELAADIRRYLGNKPVEARNATAIEHARMFAKRNPPLAAALVTSVALLIGGLAVSGRFAYLASKARDAALARELELEVVSTIQDSMLSGLDAWSMGDKLRVSLAGAVSQTLKNEPDSATPGTGDVQSVLNRVNFTTLAVRSLNESILQRYLGSINKQLAEQPVLRARLLLRLAETMRSLGLHAEAEPIARSALTIRKDTLGPDHEDTLLSFLAVGDVLSTLGRYDEALVFLNEAKDCSGSALGSEHRMTLRLSSSIAGVYRRQGRLDEAYSLWTTTLGKQRRTLGDDHADTLRTLNNIGMAHAMLGRPEEAEKCWRELLDRRRRLLGEDHPEYRGSLGNLGLLMLDLGRTAEARTLLEQSLASDRRSLGDSHPSTLTSMSQLAALMQETGDVSAAEALQTESVAGRRIAFGPEHPGTLNATVFLASLMQLQGKSSEAEMMVRECLAVQRRVLGNSHPDTAESIGVLREQAKRAGRFDEALTLSNEVLALARDAVPIKPHDVGRLISEHGHILLEAGKYAEALAPLTEGFEMLNVALGPAQLQTRKAAGRVADFYKAAHLREPNAGHDALEADWRGKADPTANGSAPSRTE